MLEFLHTEMLYKHNPPITLISEDDGYLLFDVVTHSLYIIIKLTKVAQYFLSCLGEEGALNKEKTCCVAEKVPKFLYAGLNGDGAQFSITGSEKLRILTYIPALLSNYSCNYHEINTSVLFFIKSNEKGSTL